jgi:hypothetical protein
MRELDVVTKLVGDGVRVKVFEGALEVSAVRGVSGGGVRCGVRVWGSDSVRVQQSRRRAMLRRFAVHNGLGALVSLTVAEVCSRVVMKRRVELLVRRVRASLPCSFPYVSVVEGGGEVCRPTVHGLKRVHAHVLVPGYLASTVSDRWSDGSVHVGRLGSVEEVRAAAMYLAKEFPFRSGRQYRSAVGFKPEPAVFTAGSFDEAKELAIEAFGRPPDDIDDFGDGHPRVRQMKWNTHE